MEYTDKIVVEVDVRHRHCSLISGSITTTNNIRAATTAERSRAYRARKKSETQADSDLSSIHRQHPESATYRMQECRAQKKKAIPVANGGFPIQVKCRKSDAERAKEYRARKKAKIQTEASDIGNVPDPIQYSNIGDNHCSVLSDNQYRDLTDNQTKREQIQEPRASVLSSIYHQHPESATHRMQECRDQKEKETPVANGGFPIQLKCRKSDAERAKEYRARKKAKIQTKDVGPHTMVFGQNTWKLDISKPIQTEDSCNNLKEMSKNHQYYIKSEELDLGYEEIDISTPKVNIKCEQVDISYDEDMNRERVAIKCEKVEMSNEDINNTDDIVKFKIKNEKEHGSVKH